MAIGGNLLFANLGGMPGYCSFEITLLYCCLMVQETGLALGGTAIRLQNLQLS